MNTGPFSLAVLTVGAQQTYRTMKNHPRTPVTEKPEPSLGEGLGKQFRHYQIHFVSEVTAQTRGGPGSLSKSDGLRQDLGLPWALTAVVVVVGSGKLHLSPPSSRRCSPLAVLPPPLPPGLLNPGLQRAYNSDWDREIRGPFRISFRFSSFFRRFSSSLRAFWRGSVLEMNSV